MTRKIWHIGNTTVRNPYRIQDGLLAISSANLEGKLRGVENEKKLRDALGSSGLVKLGNDETYSVGRKWRSVMGQLGFLVPKTTKALEEKISDLGGTDTLSKNGVLLMNASTLPAIHEAFLRSLLVYKIPNHSEKTYDFSSFSPLRFVLDILLHLEKSNADSKISFVEMATIVQVSSYDDGIEGVVAKIIEHREKRKNSESKRVFDNLEKRRTRQEMGVAENTLEDYADVNFRYLKICGLFSTSGRSIVLYKEKRDLIEKIINTKQEEMSDEDYIKLLCNGANLPTDNFSDAKEELEKLIHKASSKGLKIDDLSDNSTVQSANANRYQLEERLFLDAEEEFARNQKNEWPEIVKYLEVLSVGKNIEEYEEEGIYIPKTERPAYFEWALWRAFLAINHMVNKPYEARRFKVDQNFLPLSTAPGSGPDSIFEFENFVIGMEVTLTESSRQESAESESVKRHIAKMSEQYDKDVYGLFLARKIDSNAAHTFHTGVWFNKKDEQVGLSIVPIPLDNFTEYFQFLFTSKNSHPDQVKKLLNKCIEAKTGSNGPLWKQQVVDIVVDTVSQ